MKNGQSRSQWPCQCRVWLLVCLFFISAASLGTPAQAGLYMASSQKDHAKFTLVTERNAIGSSQPIQAGVLIEAQDGWHTYWENPGDAGLATRFAWTLPLGFTASPIDWPLPQRLVEGPLVTYAYPGTVFLPVSITTPSSLSEKDNYKLHVKVDILVCSDICVPESAELETTLPMTFGESKPTEFAPLFEAHRQHRPTSVVQNGTFAVDANHPRFVEGDRIRLSVPLSSLTKDSALTKNSALKNPDVVSAYLFMREMNLINYAAEQRVAITDNAITLSIPRTEESPKDLVSGLLLVKHSDDSEDSFNVTYVSGAAATAATSAASAAASASTAPVQEVWFPTALLFAVIGGLILNLMPCVLPILSLKALAIAQKSASKHEHVVRHGIAYTAGILLSFAAFAIVLLALRQAGASIGWGFQMQSPEFVGFLIYLLFLVGLNLSGFFHLPVLLGNVGTDTSGHEGSVRGSFFTGVLATAVATPCTAPFMAGAVGAALTMPAWQALLVFEALGFGLALPFLLISLFPALRRFLPKPGAWMEHFRQFLAFPMYGSAIWLLWVLTLQAGASGMVTMLSGMLAITFILWMKSWFEEGHPHYRIIAIVLYILTFAITLPMLREMSTEQQSTQTIESVPYSKDKLAELRKAGTPVFLDATAAWCITCQLNIRTALHTQNVMQAFKDRGITLMIADWTRTDDAITELLRGFGFSGVPLAVFYPAPNNNSGGEPIVLPQILTESIILNTITPKGEH